MATYIYQAEAKATTNLTYAKLVLETDNVYLRPNNNKTVFKSSNKDIDVHGNLNIVFKCKGWQYTNVTLTITKVDSSSSKVIYSNIVTVGDDPDEEIKIGKLTDETSPV